MTDREHEKLIGDSNAFLNKLHGSWAGMAFPYEDRMIDAAQRFRSARKGQDYVKGEGAA